VATDDDGSESCPRTPVLRVVAAPSAPTLPTPAPQRVGRHIHPPFLLREEVPNDIGPAASKGIFIDDVLATAEWCVSLDTELVCAVQPRTG